MNALRSILGCDIALLGFFFGGGLVFEKLRKTQDLSIIVNIQGTKNNWSSQKDIRVWNGVCSSQ